MAPIKSAICETEALSRGDRPQMRRQRPERIFSILEEKLLVEYDVLVGVWNEPSLQSVRHPESLCLINSLAFALCRKSVLWGALHGSPLMTAPRLALPKRHVLSFRIFSGKSCSPSAGPLCSSLKTRPTLFVLSESSRWVNVFFMDSFSSCSSGATVRSSPFLLFCHNVCWRLPSSPTEAKTSRLTAIILHMQTPSSSSDICSQRKHDGISLSVLLSQ